MGKATGLRITRLFTKPGDDPLDSVAWGRRDSRITNPDGSVVFEMKDAEIPTSWSQVAADIMVSKYLRKAGVPQLDESGEPIRDDEGRGVLGPERSARQVLRRLTSTWRWWGERSGYFASEADAHAFEDELAYMLVNQMAAPNSPQWFNTGLHHAYGLTGPAQGFWYVDPATGHAVPSPDSYSRPAPHACFIQSIEDDLVNEGGIMDLWVREARLFKFGAGTGTNFSRIRAENEPLSGGGRSSGVMSFLRIGDRAAGAIKSGGTTRRAAKMVILDIDHPDVEEFINWKKGEEEKVRALIAAGYSSDFNGEAYQTVAGQNANNSVRVSNGFVRAVLDDGDWQLTARTNGRVMRTVRARQLWQDISEAAWACADPGLQFDTTINEWHTCPVGGRIRASNPCSEYMFLDNTACNLASLNLGSFFDDDSGTFNIEAYQHAIRLWTIVLEVSVTMAHFPSREIAQGSYDYRTLGLGYANLGSLLMRSGIAYDSDEGRAIAAALTALLTGVSYSTSAEIASVLGPFPRFAENRADMLRVIRNHRRAAYDASQDEYEGISHRVMGVDPLYCPGALLEAAQRAWDSALDMGEQYGYRNAQTTCLAPTGTIGLQMDCDTTGVEPDFALVKFKKLAGGGYFKIANQSIDPALCSLGYSAEERAEMVRYVVGTMTLEGAPHIDRAALVSLGLTDGEVDAVERALPGVFELRHAFSPYVIGEDALARLGVGEALWKTPGFDLLRHLGFTSEQVREAGDHICGRQTIEGAPYLHPEHLPVFDTANRNGRYGTRFIHHTGHIKAMAAVQPFITGAISKCVIGDTLLTTGEGLLRIGSLHLDERPDSFRDEILEVASLGGSSKTDAFYYGGRRPVRGAVLRSGHSITGTPNHRVLVGGNEGLEWRRLDQLHPGEYVATRYGADLWATIPFPFDGFRASALRCSQKSVRLPERMTAELAFLLGAFVAEGHASLSNWTVVVTNADEGVLARVADAWRSEFGVEPRIMRPAGKCPAVVVSSKTLVEFLDYLGCGHRASDKRIPDAVLLSPREMVLSFLSGLFLDGYVSLGPAAKVGICMDSPKLLDDLQPILTNLGVVHSRITKHDRHYHKNFDEVYATGSEAQRLAGLVPFAEAHKAAAAARLLACRFGQSTADVVPGLSPRQLYSLLPRGKSGRGGHGVRSEFSFLLDPRTRHVSRRTLERIAGLPGVTLPEWCRTVLSDGLHFSPVASVADAGCTQVFDLSVPGSHAFVGNGILNHNTINMPSEATVAEIQEAYMLSWQLGLKAMALYRDGSKASQPLSVTSDEGHSPDEEPVEVSDALEAQARVVGGYFAPGVSPSQAYKGTIRPRFVLPSRRRGWTQEARVGGHKIFLRTGEYADGTLGELFIDLAKEGATLRGILSCFAIAVSKGLQYGVPLEEFVDTFTFHTFEPRGLVEGHPNIKMANSIVDYVFRALGLEYLGRTDLVQVPPAGERELPEPPSGLAVDAGLQLELTDAASAAMEQTAPISHPAVADRPAARVSPTAAGNGQRSPARVAVPAAGGDAARAQALSVQGALGSLMGGAPLCDVCGHITVRNGSCYKCLNCGNSMGCS